MAKNSLLDNILPQHKSKKQGEKIILAAQAKGQKIVKKAVLKSNQILQRSNLFHKNLRDLVKAELKVAVAKSAALYQQELNQAVSRSLEEFREIVRSEFVATQKLLLEKTQQEWQVIKQDLEQYKRAKMAEIESKINQEVKNLAIAIIGRALPEEVTERLILEALEKAKKQGLFDL